MVIISTSAVAVSIQAVLPVSRAGACAWAKAVEAGRSAGKPDKAAAPALLGENNRIDLSVPWIAEPACIGAPENGWTESNAVPDRGRHDNVLKVNEIQEIGYRHLCRDGHHETK